MATLAAKPKAASPYPTRLRRLAEAAAGQRADHFLVTSPIDVGYLTGFLGGDSYLIVPASGGRGRPVIVSDFRYQEELEPTQDLADVFIRHGSMASAVGEVLNQRRSDRCAVQAEHVTLSDMDNLVRALGAASRVAPTTGVVPGMRVKKDEHEIALIAAATKLQEKALLAVLPTIRPGQTELEIAARLEAEMKTRGSSQPGFQSIIAARANGSLPHYRPGKAKTAKGQPLLIDWGATYHGYQSDMTRTFALGKWPKKVAEIYKIVEDAQRMSADTLGPGRTAHEVDAVARNHITRHGYGEFFGHGLGHGLGMVKDPPYLNPLYPNMTLEPGHVVTVEPGIYLPGVGGVRIEDIYVITEKGARNFCSLPKGLEWSTL